MAIPNQTLELTNSNQMPPVISLTGQEVIPAATDNTLTRLPISFTPVKIGDYVFGTYTYNLTNYLDTVGNTVTPLSEILMVDNGQTYKIEISELSEFISPSININTTGLAYLTGINPNQPVIDVPKATVVECDLAILDTVAVTPLGLSSYKNRLDVLEAEIAALLYVPVDITSFTATPSVVEIGQSVPSVSLDWAINKTITSQTVNGNSLNSTQRNVIVTGPFSSNWTTNMSATDGQTTDSASASLSFRNKRYWGVSTNTTLTSSEIILLNSEFSTSRTKDVTYDATGGNYVYYAYPVSFGSLNAVKVGGLSFSDYTTTVITFTNASGFSSQYNLIRINNIQTGSNIQVHWE